MSKNEPYDDPKLKGFQRYFNNYTIRGRSNVAIATFSGLALIFVYRKLFKKKPIDPSDF